MNKYQKEITKSVLSEEEAVLKKLRGIYKKALDDIDSNIASLMGREDEENLQTIIYQTQYQKALKQQINGILDDLNTQQFNSISDYLAKSYEEGFSGVLYDLNKQGIPLTLPIDQKQVVYALQNDSKLSKPLYDSLGEDIDLLKKRIQNNISRGIATGSSYADIAKNIASGMVGDYSKMRGGALGKAYTITRTEGHRIQQKASEDARQEAKNHGADIVKQWDSTLDGRTRPTHVDLDGQIKELDEPFTNGLMYAGDPSGSAGEVINCRCVILQIPRWAIDDGFTKYDSFTKEQRDFADPKDYNEFKEWYFSEDNKKYMKYVYDLEEKYGIKKFETLLDTISDREYRKLKDLESKSPLFDVSKRGKKANNNSLNATQGNDKILEKPVKTDKQYYDELLKEADSSNIVYNPVTYHEQPLTEDEIIKALSGGDRTQGSCASVGLAYIGQKNGFNMLDFRDGASREMFSDSINLFNLSKAEGMKAIHYGDVAGKSSCTLANNFLKQCEVGKEYYLCVGRHASIVRAIEDNIYDNATGEVTGTKIVYQYLELQSAKRSGWMEFNGNPKFTLTHRFGCSSASGHGERWDFMLNITDSDFDNDEFKSLMGYINTAEDQQKKGVTGVIR